MFSFLGGMRAVTWTQVAQYIVLIVAYMIPVVWLSVKHTGFPIPQLVYGYVLQKVGEREKQLIKDPKELEVRKIFADRAAAATANLKGLPGSYEAEKGKLAKAIEDLKAQNAPAEQVASARRPRSRSSRRASTRRRRRGRRRRASRPARDRRCSTPKRSPARTKPRATPRGGTSSR